MRILGIDCGAHSTGYGIVDTDGKTHRMVECGAIRTQARDPFPDRLAVIARRLRELIDAHRPDCAAVESVFHHVNARTALKLAHVRGIALLTAAEAGLSVGEYSPLEVKSSVVGYGRAEKHQVQLMVRSLLGLKEEVSSLDASDAIAVAICHGVREAHHAWLESNR
jgi:crossover junction endodeoxyribonuclease RuvC